MYIKQFIQRLMLTDEEMGILNRLFDKAGITFGEAESEANSQEFDLIDFTYKLYFHSSVEALFTVNRKNITEGDWGQINRIISKNKSYVLDATETTRNNLIDFLSRTNKRLEWKAYQEGEGIGKENGYEEGRRLAILEIKEYFEYINSKIPGFFAGYIEGLSKSHFHVPCEICYKPMHFDESDNDWSEILPDIESSLEGIFREEDDYMFNDEESDEDKEIKFLNHPSTSFEQFLHAQDLNNLSFIIGQEHEHLRLKDKKSGTIKHFDQFDKNWPVIKRILENLFYGWHHTSCYEEQERKSEQNRDDY